MTPGSGRNPPGNFNDTAYTAPLAVIGRDMNAIVLAKPEQDLGRKIRGQWASMDKACIGTEQELAIVVVLALQCLSAISLILLILIPPSTPTLVVSSNLVV